METRNRSHPGLGWGLGWAVGLAGLLVVGCGPGALPNNNFGSAGGSQTEGTVTATQSSATVTAEGTATSVGDEISDTAESFETEGVPSGESPDSSGEATASTVSTMEAETASAEDPDTFDTFDTFDSMDTWGIPPDVTNEPCEPLAQDCFPTHKCVPFATEPGGTFLDADKCMPILGTQAWGEACTLSGWNESQDDCDGDGFCWNLELVDGELQGTCVPFCTGTPQNLSCPVGWGCLFSGAIALCAKQCDPLVQDCPLDYGCYWAGNGFDCALEGWPGGDLDNCGMVNDCLPGLACVDQGGLPACTGDDDDCCTPWCDLDLADPCTQGRSCVAFFAEGQAPLGSEDIGLCLLP